MVQSGYTSPFPKKRMPMQTATDSPALTLGIAGAGAMGRGIAQIAAQAGVRVLLFDLAPGAARDVRCAAQHAGRGHATGQLQEISTCDVTHVSLLLRLTSGCRRNE